MERRMATVSQINAYIKNALDGDFLLQNIWIKGEISNFKLHYSGHMYMSLKDKDGVLRAVMFRGANASLPFVPENGMQVLARGRISVYPRDGAYQLYIEEMEQEGAGALYLAFEKLKAKLEKEGLFDPQRKKPIPKYPRRVGVVTSATGAAVQDICNILKRRYQPADIILCPVLVQGEGAAEQIANAIEQFNVRGAADVLIVGRGGGSIEDLWAFNEEIVARAVAASAIPVISAVGHETDFTICDFVADLRAPTPSAAAELAVPSGEELRERLQKMGDTMGNHLQLSLSRRQEQLTKNKNRMHIAARRMDDLRYTLDTFSTRMASGLEKKIAEGNASLGKTAASLDALSPLKVLSRGYLVAEKNERIVRSSTDLAEGDILHLRLCDGGAECVVERVEKNDI
ncbi:MAG: exodeoxyribonuclease VII large subunit [Clostridia bacterium]|nr:exodeoxyribonuclease VII large subunit [Clostridia bacterium]